MPLLQNPETGEVRIVDDPQGLLSQGWRVPSAEQADQAAQEADFGGFGQQAQAQVERVVRGATLGALPGFGSSEDIRARADVSQKLSPVTSFAADVAPQVGLGALAAATGGAAAVGLGAVEGGAMAGTAALAAESATGGLVGAGQAAYERGQYLGEDPGRDAENALIFGGLNFGLGAVSRALFGGGAKAAESASRFATEGEEAAVEGAGKETLEGVAQSAQSEAQDIVEQAIGSDVPTQEADSFARQRALYQNRQAILDVSVKEMQTDITDLMADVPNVARGGKIEDVSRNVGENLSAQRAVSDGIAQNAAELAGTLRGEARAYAAASGRDGLQYAVPGSKDLVRGLTESAQALADADSGKAMFEAANSFKQLLDDHKLSFEQGMANSLNPKAFQDLLPRVSTLASQVRTALEDPAVWGKAGDMQKAYNAVISDQLIPSMKIFEDSVLKRTSKGYDAMWKTEGWESKIESLLQGNDLGKVRHVNGVLDALDQLASIRSEYGDAATGSRMSDKVAKIRRTIGLAEEVQDATGRMQALGQIAGHTPLVGGLAKEWVTGDLANAFRRLTGAVDRGIDRGVDDWIASSRVRSDSGSMLGNVASFTARAITGGGDQGTIAAIARRQGISHGLARFMGQDQTPQAAFERARAALQNDEQFFQAMGQDYKSLQEQSPETYLMLSGRAAQLRSFLLQRMPANVSVSMMRPEGYPPSRDSIEDWSVYWNAAKDPMHVVSNVRSARIQELQTLQAGYPRLYERMQQRVIEKIGAAQGRGKPLDDSLLMRMNLLFQLDGAGSPAFSRQVGRLADEWNAQQQQAAPTAVRAGKPRMSLTPGPVQSIAQTGATFGTSPY